jgi:hypothetical protein
MACAGIKINKVSETSQSAEIWIAQLRSATTFNSPRAHRYGLSLLKTARAVEELDQRRPGCPRRETLPLRDRRDKSRIDENEPLRARTVSVSPARKFSRTLCRKFHSPLRNPRTGALEKSTEIIFSILAQALLHIGNLQTLDSLSQNMG